jgi:hypothetical protein
MVAVAAGRRSKIWSFNRMKDVISFLSGLVLIGGASTAALAADSEPVKKIPPLLEEDRIHKLAIFSYMRPPRGRGRSIPILVTLNIRGPEGLQTFCEYRPMIFEAVLIVTTEEPVSTGDRKSLLADMKSHILEAVNYSLPGEPISSVEARAGRSTSEFSQDIVQTRGVCRQLDALIK